MYLLHMYTTEYFYACVCVTIHCVSMHFSNSQNEGTPEDAVSTSSNSQDEATSEDEASTSSPTVVSSEGTSKYITVREETKEFMSMLNTVAYPQTVTKI